MRTFPLAVSTQTLASLLRDHEGEGLPLAHLRAKDLRALIRDMAQNPEQGAMLDQAIENGLPMDLSTGDQGHVIGKEEGLLNLVLFDLHDRHFSIEGANTIPVEGYFTLVERLLDQGTNPNRANEDGHYPLHQSCDLGLVFEKSLTKLLLDHGALLDVTDVSGNTPLAYALETSEFEMAEAMLDRGAKVGSPEMAAFLQGIVRASWQEGADSDREAALAYLHTLLARLVQAGADPSCLRMDSPLVTELGDDAHRGILGLLLTGVEQARMERVFPGSEIETGKKVRM
jgi:ankyrin repeat protein